MINIFSNWLNWLNFGKENFFDFYKSLFSHLEVKIYLLTLIIINVSCWYLARMITRFFSDAIITLHYNVDFGINLIGEPGKIYVIPLLGLIMIIINFLLLNILDRNIKDRKINRHLILASAVVANLTLLVALISLYIINLNR